MSCGEQCYRCGCEGPEGDLRRIDQVKKELRDVETSLKLTESYRAREDLTRRRLELMEELSELQNGSVTFQDVMGK